MNGFFVTNELDKYDEAIKQGMAGVLCSDEELAKEIAEAMYAAKSKQDNSEVEEYIGNLRVLLDDLGEELDHLEVALANENGELDDGEGECGLCGGCGWLDVILDEDEDEDEYEEDEYNECRSHSSYEECAECNEWKCPYCGR
jgi:hypothetical protein